MWVGIVSTKELAAASRWTVSYFSTALVQSDSIYPMKKIREVATESKTAVDPQNMREEAINYIGLENIRSKTGELVDFHPRSPTAIKSRSKTFVEGDVLFGRLRPELNKVYLVEKTVSPGVCSNEFIVLRPKSGVLDARYFRHILASQFVNSFAAKLRSGASLPRMNSADLLDLSIPVPPIDVQITLSAKLGRLDLRLSELRRAVEKLPGALSSGMMTYLNGRDDELDAVEREFI